MESCIVVILVVCCTLFMCVVVVAGTVLKVSNDATSAIEQTTVRLTGTTRATTDTFQSRLAKQFGNAAKIAPSTGIGDTHDPSFVQRMLSTLYSLFSNSRNNTVDYSTIPPEFK
jgi:hypothetical protein